MAVNLVRRILISRKVLVTQSFDRQGPWEDRMSHVDRLIEIVNRRRLEYEQCNGSYEERLRALQNLKLARLILARKLGRPLSHEPQHGSEDRDQGR